MKKIILGLLLIGTMAQAKITKEIETKMLKHQNLLEKSSTGYNTKEINEVKKKITMLEIKGKQTEYCTIIEVEHGTGVYIYDQNLKFITIEFLDNLNTQDIIDLFTIDDLEIIDKKIIK
jgi:hypothetical protein